MTDSTIHWFAFTAFNQQAVYATGTTAEAASYADILNKGREINQYHAAALGGDQVAELDLENNSDAFSLDDALRAHGDEE